MSALPIPVLSSHCHVLWHTVDLLSSKQHGQPLPDRRLTYPQDTPAVPGSRVQTALISLVHHEFPSVAHMGAFAASLAFIC